MVFSGAVSKLKSANWETIHLTLYLDENLMPYHSIPRFLRKLIMSNLSTSVEISKIRNEIFGFLGLVSLICEVDVT